MSESKGGGSGPECIADAASAKAERKAAFLKMASEAGELMHTSILAACPEMLADAAPDKALHVCDSCSLGGDTSEKPCEFREDTGIPAPGWLCAECYSAWKEQPE